MDTYAFSCVISSLYSEMYLSCMTLKKSNELNAYCCIPKLFVYKSLNIVGLCSPANNLSWEDVTL